MDLDVMINTDRTPRTGMNVSVVEARRSPRGLTIVELLIVVIVLGIVAFTVVPRFSRAAVDIQDSRFKNHLEVVRRQIELYRIELGGQYPSATTEEAFLDQMLRRQVSAVSADDPAASDSRRGPYLQEIPINPYTGGKRITCGGRPGENPGDWHYDPETGRFRANSPPEKISY